MKTITKTLYILLFLLLSFPLLGQPKQNSEPRSLVFTHVTVIDATGAPAKRDMTVVIMGERIAEIGRAIRLNISTS